MAVNNNKENRSSSKHLLKERFEIDYNIPLPKFNTNNAIAYKAVDISNKKQDLFALVTSTKTPARLSMLPNYQSIKHSSLIKLVDYGVVFDKHQDMQTIALIYQKPLGPKVLDITPAQLNAIKKDNQKLSDIIASSFSALETLKGHGITHRAIRPDNLYFADPDLSTIVIGDCLSCFPGYFQPYGYESVEQAMAGPLSKSNGSAKDDFYSMAATLLAFLNNSDKLANFDKNTIISRKISETSYNFLSSVFDIPDKFAPLFKAVLDDNQQTRWSYVDVYNFIKDKTPELKRPTNSKAKKSITINSIKYQRKEAIAFLFSQDLSLAMTVINSKAFAEWIRKDEDFLNKDALLDILSTAAIQQIDKDILIAKICILLAPTLPIFYKTLKCFPKGLYKAMYYAKQNTPKELGTYIELIESGLIEFWYSKQEFLRAPTNISEHASFISNSDLGYGLQRVIYDADDDIPCFSPLLGGVYVYSAGGLLRALEANATDENTLFDNGIIAYLRCKLGSKFEAILREINTIKSNQKRLAIIKLYIDLQNRYGPKKLPNLTSIMADYAAPLISLYHNKETQVEVKKNLAKAASTGLLNNIYSVLQNPKDKEQDAKNFAQAKNLALRLRLEEKQIQEADFESPDGIKSAGIKFVMMLSVFVAVLMFVFSLMAHFR